MKRIYLLFLVLPFLGGCKSPFAQFTARFPNLNLPLKMEIGPEKPVGYPPLSRKEVRDFLVAFDDKASRNAEGGQFYISRFVENQERELKIIPGAAGKWGTEDWTALLVSLYVDHQKEFQDTSLYSLFIFDKQGLPLDVTDLGYGTFRKDQGQTRTKRSVLIFSSPRKIEESATQDFDDDTPGVRSGWFVKNWVYTISKEGKISKKEDPRE